MTAGKGETTMNDNENKKTPEALADEELDKVDGGKSVIIEPFGRQPIEGATPDPPDAIGGKTGGTV